MGVTLFITTIIIHNTEQIYKKKKKPHNSLQDINDLKNRKYREDIQ